MVLAAAIAGPCVTFETSEPQKPKAEIKLEKNEEPGKINK